MNFPRFLDGRTLSASHTAAQTLSRTCIRWTMAALAYLALVGLAPIADAQSCTGLCLQQVTCSNSAVSTTISGTVFAPNGTDPLPGVLVYIPNAPVQPFPSGVQCLQAGQPASGSPLVSTTTAIDGTFTLKNAPVGSNIPLVIQAGKWRRQFVIPSVASCANTATPTSGTNQIRFPKTATEGDIPNIALVTGEVDALECVMRKIGVADSEFTNPTGPGHIKFYLGAAGAGARINTSTPSETQLEASQATMNGYDLLMYACQGEAVTKSAAILQTVQNYANAGGRIFATHYNYDLLATNGNFAGVAKWNPGESTSLNDGTAYTAYVDTTFPKGAALAQWLQVVHASTTLGQVPVSVIRKDQDGVVAPTQSYLSIQNPSESIQFTFNTPVGAAPANQCGRVLFNEYHVENAASTSGLTFPNECTTAALTPQEKLLEYSIFDLSTFVSPDVPPTASVSFTNGASPVTQGDAADSVTITVTNTSTTTPANPSLTATVALPTGLTATALAPQNQATSGWNCNVGALTCTRTSGLDANASDPIVLTFSVAANAPAAETITATVSGGGLAANVSATDSFPVRIVPTINWPSPAPILYGTALSSTQLDATATYNGNPVPGTFVYTPAAGTVPAAGNQTLNVTFTPTDTTAYTSANGSVVLQVNQATPAIAWSTPAAITYGTALSSTQLNATASFNGSPVAGTFAYMPTAGTVLGAGSQTLQVTFTPTDTNSYTTAGGSVTLQVNQATPSVSWATPAAITYGTALSSAQLNATSPVAGTFAYTPAAGTVPGAGSQTLQASFTPTDTVDYTSASASVILQVNKATPTISWATPAAITYGTALSSAQLNATSPVAGTFAYTPTAGTVLGAGSQTLQVSFTPTDAADYTSATASVILQVNKAAPSVSWATPAAITYGTALSSTQLNATSPVAGTFAYTPTAGTVLGAGSQTLQVSFTPTDTADYTSATASVILQVNKAAPSISWATPAAITYGTALSSTQLNATSPVAGTFAYTPAAGTVPGAGSQTLQVSFTPTDAADYTSATASVILQVNKKTPTLTWATPAPIPYGTPLSSTQLNATASVAGTFAYNPASGVLSAGPHTLTVVFTPTDTADYTTANAAVSLTVNKAATTTTIAVATSQTVSGTTATITATVSPQISGTPTGTVTYLNGTTVLGSAPVGTPFTTGALPAGSDQLSATYSGDSNFNTSTSTKTTVTGVLPTTVQLLIPIPNVLYPLPVGYTVIVPLKNFQLIGGTVTIYDGNTAIATLPMLPGGVIAGVTLPPLAPGTHQLRAVYNGDSHYPPGQSPVVTVTVTKLGFL